MTELSSKSDGWTFLSGSVFDSNSGGTPPSAASIRLERKMYDGKFSLPIPLFMELILFLFRSYSHSRIGCDSVFGGTSSFSDLYAFGTKVLGRECIRSKGNEKKEQKDEENVHFPEKGEKGRKKRVEGE